MILTNPQFDAEFRTELLNALPGDFSLNNEQIRQFEVYVNLILQWNKKAGLISPGDEKRLIKRHLIESLGVVSVNLLWPGAEVLDLGSGGGFPGIPVKIAMPSLQMTLLDSRRMKALFLEEVVRSLALENTQVVHDRAEQVVQKFKAGFDFVLARAVADLQTLWKWAHPLLKKGGTLLAQKGGEIDSEIKLLQASYSHLQPQRIDYADTWAIDASRFVIAITKRDL